MLLNFSLVHLSTEPRDYPATRIDFTNIHGVQELLVLNNPQVYLIPYLNFFSSTHCP